MGKELKSVAPTEIRVVDTYCDMLANPDEFQRAYMAQPLVQCTLPHNDPGNEPIWTRQNGDLMLSLQPHINPKTRKPEYPYGTLPRLLLTWICSEAVKTKKRELVLGSSLADFMKELKLDPSRGGARSHRKALQKQLPRLLRAKISIDDERLIAGAHRSSFADLQVGEKAVLWWDQRQNHDQPSLFKSTLTLRPDFFEMICKNPVPLDIRALYALKNSSLALDLYIWLVYRTYTIQKLDKPQFIAWSLIAEQFGSEYKRLDNFVRKAKSALENVQFVYPGLSIEYARGGVRLRPGKLAIPQRAS